MEIKATISTSPNGYGFGYDWTLVITKDGIPKRFWLGQAEKYCCRVLGVSQTELLQRFNETKSVKDIKEQIAEYIFEVLSDKDPEEVAEKIYDNLQSWELSCE